MADPNQQRRRTFPCPKCGRRLVQSGELVIDETTHPTFQCDECLMPVDFMGEKTEVALTFALDPEDQPFDPASEDGRLRF